MKLFLVAPLCLGLVVGSLSSAEEERGPVGSPPSVLLVMADDLGLECLGCYGGTSYETPHLDALARGGLRFTNCFSTPKCSPSRVTLLTGRYTFRTTNEWGYIPPEEVTVGQVLRDAGYATALAGKWQLGLLREDPRRVAKAGFEESCSWGWHEGPRYWQPMIYENGKPRGDIADRYGPDVYCDFLVEFIERHAREPFLAYYPMTLVHWPKPDEPKGPRGRYETFPEMVREMDRRVGRLVATLDRLGIRERTVVLFTGDNGTPRNVVSRLGDRTIRGGKALLTDAGTRVPLIVSWPGTARAGGVVEDLVDFSDFLPTLAELARVEPPEGVAIDGRSFAPRIRGERGTPRTWVYTEFEGRCWIRNLRWKLYGNGVLRDMVSDPEEARDVDPGAEGEEGRAARRLLSRTLRELKASARKEAGGTPPDGGKDGEP